MNKILSMLLAISYGWVAAYGQIGINTEFPLRVFHVDGAGDNTSSNPSEAEQLNDVVVTSAGNLGIGTLTPVTKVDLKNDPISSVSSLRIQDKLGAYPNKVLESGTDGIAFWAEQPPSITKTYAAVPAQKFITRVRTRLVTDSDMVIPQNGKYLLTLRWWSYYRWTNSPSKKVSIYVYVLKRGITGDLDQIEYYLLASQNQVISFTTSLYLGDCTAGEIVDIEIYPSIGGSGGDGQTQYELYGNATRPDLIPQVILYSI
ncbi:hypothetical protein [Dysgonomonas macrotermitis]|uniref:Uncharacterized protein n=1 Tax=Dysgonomonas macrotermitis TaxID=1346286 RepID=A0A1M4WF72_9BACT|nr:hypothetical protein [Dysgonomonas macrotermitis]SHE79827.1 hypothetical protein SAMN05444362_102211 [Dysgonomonas macrotermitis]